VEVEAPKPIFDLLLRAFPFGDWATVHFRHCIYLFLKVSQCKLKEKETILMLGNALKSKSKIGLGASTSTLYQGFTLNPLGTF
jgi:hypothetical protein